MAATETFLHNAINLDRMVDRYIAPSEFLRQKFIEYGFKEQKMESLNYITDISVDYISSTDGNYLIYIGRLSEEKGIKNLIDAVADVESCDLKIVGDGPLKQQLISYVKSKKMNKRIEFLGYRNRNEIIKLIRNSKFLVIPSEWYEVTGLVIFEAYACGKPVVGSRIGGIPEFVKDTERGLVFEPGDKDDLKSAIRYLLANPDLVLEMGLNARKYVEQEYSPEMHYQKLMKIYNNVLSEKHAIG
jgi:glycosyltransferase involved in cell wall biosynthesis